MRIWVHDLSLADAFGHTDSVEEVSIADIEPYLPSPTSACVVFDEGSRSYSIWQHWRTHSRTVFTSEHVSHLLAIAASMGLLDEYDSIVVTCGDETETGRFVGRNGGSILFDEFGRCPDALFMPGDFSINDMWVEEGVPYVYESLDVSFLDLLARKFPGAGAADAAAPCNITAAKFVYDRLDAVIDSFKRLNAIFLDEDVRIAYFHGASPPHSFEMLRGLLSDEDVLAADAMLEKYSCALLPSSRFLTSLVTDQDAFAAPGSEIAKHLWEAMDSLAFKQQGFIDAVNRHWDELPEGERKRISSNMCSIANGSSGQGRAMASGSSKMLCYLFGELGGDYMLESLACGVPAGML